MGVVLRKNNIFVLPKLFFNYITHCVMRLSSDQNALLDTLKCGGEAGLRKLFDRYYIPLCVYSMQITNSFEQSEDIVQDFFISFWEKKIYNNINSNLRNYLFLSVRNLSLAAIKRDKTVVISDTEKELYAVPSDDYDPEEVAEMLHKLYQEMDKLPEQARRVFEEIILNKRRYKEVAQEMNVSVNTVKTQLSRALKRLKGSLNVVMI